MLTSVRSTNYDEGTKDRAISEESVNDVQGLFVIFLSFGNA